MRVFSILSGDIKTSFVEVEFHSRFQIPAFHILGLPAPEIQEAKERIMASFQAAEFEFPKKKVIINLAPAAVKKSGTGHDLAIAAKVLSETLEQDWPESVLAWGELSLEGQVKPVGRMAGVLDLLVHSFFRNPPVLLLCSRDAESFLELLSWRKSVGLPNPRSLKLQVIDMFQDLGEKIIPRILDVASSSHEQTRDWGHLLPLPARAERVLKISLIGKHHVLLLGPKGVGKSESIRWYQALLPESTAEQSWQRLLIAEHRHLPNDFRAPVRRVHAQVKPAHLLGTFSERGYLPGELALAHGGLFIADEFLEWPRDSKECLREPLQAKKIFLTRVKGQIECPADFQMIATGNLCACGGLPQPFRGEIQRKKFKCKCRPSEVDQYLQKLSGPILDRIDLSFIMTETERKKLAPDLALRLLTEIKAAREFSRKNFGCLGSELSPESLEDSIERQEGIQKLLADVNSLRSRHKILRVAHSIAALENTKVIKEEHVFEAKWYRFESI